MDPETKYSTLLVAFRKLYENSMNIAPETYLQLHYVATFVSEEMFKTSLPEESL